MERRLSRKIKGENEFIETENLNYCTKILLISSVTHLYEFETRILTLVGFYTPKCRHDSYDDAKTQIDYSTPSRVVRRGIGLAFLPANYMNAGSNPDQDEFELLLQSESTSFKLVEASEYQTLMKPSLSRGTIPLRKKNPLLMKPEEDVL
ncbi:hypothetical protein AVEN_147213-1 [Araneus ventricosus]|uniref:Uncharacterized protein n=1 Tax=Araneus ventricosus TaxID=182803 RepID=A0A4Y2V0Z8_ARAVE|nr:hypothetical protein AVEN_147213-1 [Araneus ventricosus]